jgi:HEAT repeat protein
VATDSGDLHDVTFQQLRRACRKGDLASLIAALDSDREIRSYPVRAAAARHLGHLRARNALPALLRLLDDSNETVRTVAAIALGSIGDLRAAPRLREALDDPDPLVRARVIASLGEIGDPSAIPALIEIAQNGGWFFERAPALYALLLMPQKEAKRTAKPLLAHERFFRRRSVRAAARKFEKKRDRRHRHRLVWRSAAQSGRDPE